MNISLKSHPLWSARVRAHAAVDVLLLRRSALACARRMVHRPAMISVVFLCFTHGLPFTRLHHCDGNAAQLARPRRIPPRVDRGPLVASLFLQGGWNNPALQSRKNSAATSHPPIAWVHSSRPHASTARAPSRRLQRVSLSCARVPRGQAPRRRPFQRLTHIFAGSESLPSSRCRSGRSTASSPADRHHSERNHGLGADGRVRSNCLPQLPATHQLVHG